MMRFLVSLVSRQAIAGVLVVSCELVERDGPLDVNPAKICLFPLLSEGTFAEGNVRIQSSRPTARSKGWVSSGSCPRAT